MGPIQSAFDPVSLEVVWTRLISCVDEAAAALVRTSFSTLVRESYDFSCVITDAEGQSLVQSSHSIPSFIGTLPATVKHFLREYPLETLQPGDVLITNDIYQGTGHLPDLSVAKPIWYKGRVVGVSASTAHAADIGGKIRSPEPREVFEEGFQIPIMKLLRGGEPDRTLMKLLRKNVRVPDQVVGDLWAQVVALDLMEARTVALMEEVQDGVAHRTGDGSPGPVRARDAISHRRSARRGLSRLAHDRRPDERAASSDNGPDGRRRSNRC